MIWQFNLGKDYLILQKDIKKGVEPWSEVKSLVVLIIDGYTRGTLNNLVNNGSSTEHRSHWCKLSHSVLSVLIYHLPGGIESQSVQSEDGLLTQSD